MFVRHPIALYLLVAAITFITHANDDVMKKKELTEAVLQLTEDIKQLAEKVASPVDKQVAFLAQASSNEKYHSFPKGSPLMFDKVIFNVGNGYDPSTGVFTAPDAGVYSFSFQLFPANNGYNVMADLVQNGQVMLRNRVGNNGGGQPETLAASVTLLAEAGDNFAVQIYGGEGDFWAGFHTFFAGALVSRSE